MGEQEYVESYSELNKLDLIEECKAREIDSHGNKAVLVARLEAYDVEHADEEDVPDDGMDVAENAPRPPEHARDATGQFVEDVESASKDSERLGVPETQAQALEAGSDQPSAVQEPATSDVLINGEFHVEFDLPDDFEILHEQLDHGFKLQARGLAMEAGWTPIGGAYSAHQIQHGNRGGRLTIIYGVPVRPR